jgi:DNA (cytosine-5)-methyltransferase 1
LEKVKVIDLFAGPGGLGEGFSSYQHNDVRPFRIAVSIEKDAMAHKTLQLRSFFRQFEDVPSGYYKYLKQEISREELFEEYEAEAEKAYEEAWQAELGGDEFPHDLVKKKIASQLKKVDGGKRSVVIGGPPCQAYSLVGRSRMGGQDDFDKDPRHTLYKEYLKILADFRPEVFVMENVKGILSSKLNGEFIFDKILEDLKNPQKSVNPDRSRFSKTDTYTIYSLSTDREPDSLKKDEYIIHCEKYGIPQARHRVILLGIRNDCKAKPGILESYDEKVTVKDVIGTLPKLRSGLSKKQDTYENWKQEIQLYDPNAVLYRSLKRGGEFVKSHSMPSIHKDWYHDPKLNGVINHETRGHMGSDLHRYHFMASHAGSKEASLKLEDLPETLLPAHKNVQEAISSKSLFNDRFRVQLKDRPATTITSHISKDGHYFIHYDPKQCRSMTVREAARIQTFPDNYKFEGPRTSQYIQVGNAVPPLLAKQIADIVYNLLEDFDSD